MTAPASILLFCTLVLLVFLSCQYWARGKGALHFTGCKNNKARKVNILLHAFGVLLMGVATGIVSDPFVFLAGIHTVKPPYGMAGFTTLLLSVTAAALAFREARKMAGEAEGGSSAPHLLLIYFPLRTVYIAAYEYFFRGILLFSCLQVFNSFWAILVNTVFYLVAHLMGDKKEKMGTLLLGPLLCVACIMASSYWPAVFVHLSLTLFYEGTFIRLTQHSINR